MAISIEELTSPVTENIQPTFNNLGQNTADYTTPELMIFRIMSILIWVFSVASIILFIYGGIIYATAGGDAERAEKAKKIIIGTIVGIIIFSMSYLIYRTTVKIIGGTQSPELQTEQASEGYGSEDDEDTTGGTSQERPSGLLPTTQTEDQTNP
jgi:hypothetical protein